MQETIKQNLIQNSGYQGLSPAINRQSILSRLKLAIGAGYRRLSTNSPQGEGKEIDIQRVMNFDIEPEIKTSHATLCVCNHDRNGYLLLALLCVVFSASNLYGQGFGSIQGMVTDPSGAVVSSAVITATQTNTGITTVVGVNGNGYYVFPSLPPSRYSISVSAAGFEKYVQNDIILQANQPATVNFTLRVGNTSQTVTVAANATLIDTTTGTLSQVIASREVNDLPLNGRNAAQLTTLVAGVVAAPSEDYDQGLTKTFPVVVTVSANGSRADQTDYLLDGGNNVDEYTNVNAPFPFPDTLQEFSFQTSNYNAEYGQNAGGVVNIVTKSGGRAFHGDVFEYLRNGAFNARNYFASTVDPLKRNQFGGTVGGPVRIPHLVSGQNTFFFFGYQKTIIHDQAGGTSAFVPTQANLLGDFSALLDASNPANPLGKVVQVVDPSTGIPFPGNQIPVTRFDKAAVAFDKDLPSVGGNGQVFYQQPLDQGFTEYFGRVDQQLGSTDHIFAHYYYNNFNNVGQLNTSNLLTLSNDSDIRYQNSLVSDAHTFTNNLFNNLVVNYSREVSKRGPPPNTPNVADFGVNIWQPAGKAIEDVSTDGFFQVGTSAIAIFQRNNYSLSDDLHWVKGTHNLAFGVHVELSKLDINSEYQQNGDFYFNANNSNYSVASFLLGYLYQFAQGSGQLLSNRNHFLGFYGQDIWKVSNRLSINYGLRYEPYYPWRSLEHSIEQFNADAFAAGRVSTVYINAPPGLLFPGDTGVPEQGVRPVFTNIMPRFGFAYDVFGNGRTVVRGGGGIFYDTRQVGYFNVNTYTPFSLSVTLTNPQGPFSNPYLGIPNPFPATIPSPPDVIFPSPVSVFGYDPSGNFKVPVTDDWNLTVEQQITSNMIARIAYVGAHLSHQQVSYEANPATYIPDSSLGTDQRRRYLGYSTITQFLNPGAAQSTNSLQATLQRRFSHGLTFLVNYAWSKSLDTIPYGGTLDGWDPGQSYVYPIYYPNFKALDIGRSDFDRRNVLSASYIETFPKLKSGNKIVQAIVNDWETTGIVQAYSGDPLTIVAGVDQSMTGLGQDRAQLTGQKPYGSGACLGSTNPCKNFLNPNAFALPAIGTFGNVQKGSLTGPGYFDWDAALIRSFPIKGSTLLNFRAEYFNILNRTNLSDPVNSVSSGGFGSITGASDPRIAQLSMKVIF